MSDDELERVLHRAPLELFGHRLRDRLAELP
jgi:hypothetical protein